MKRHRHLVTGLLASLALVVGACGGTTGSTSPNPTPKTGGTLTIDNESGALWQCDFNPYNGSVNGQSFGILYEPLVYDNLLNDTKTKWLASDYAWSAGQQDAHLHHPLGRAVERRPALQRGRRRVHVQPAEAAP